MISIAIDGPSGAGKSSLARRLAQELGFLYADTGALYRAVGLAALRAGVAPSNAAAVEALLPSLTLSLRHTERGQRVLLGGEDVSDLLRTPDVSMAASDVSAIPAVRVFLLGLQKDIAANNNVIMDGRDIGTVVLPHAQLKIFLTASPEDRARRRYEELVTRGIDVKFETVLAEAVERDRQDTTRAVAPLKPAPDAVVVDTTGFAFDRSFGVLLALCREKLGL